MPALAQLYRELRGFLIALRAILLAQPVLIQINQQHVLHSRLPAYRSNGPIPDRHLYQKISRIGHGYVPRASLRVEEVYRAEWGRIVATLIRLFGDFDLAEECAQEAFAAAVDQWRDGGIPDSPRAWIIQTAKHKAIDRIRRRGLYAEKLESYVVSGFIRAAEEPDYDNERNF